MNSKSDTSEVRLEFDDSDQNGSSQVPESQTAFRNSSEAQVGVEYDSNDYKMVLGMMENNEVDMGRTVTLDNLMDRTTSQNNNIQFGSKTYEHVRLMSESNFFQNSLVGT